MVDSFETYAQALAAFTAVVDGQWKDVLHFKVRDADDPHYRRMKPYGSDLALVHAARRAGYECKQKEVSATTLLFIKQAEPGDWLSTVERDTLKSLTLRGFKVDRYDVDRNIKSRITLGRCHNEHVTDAPSGGRRIVKGGGYWWPRSEGTLSDRHCPACGGRLSQTSLALQSGFRRLPRKKKGRT
jgi:hypothetical protein